MKKLISMLLALVMCVGLCVPAFATERIVTERQIQAEIQQEAERVWASVRTQLDEQGVLSLMPVVQEALLPNIEAHIRARYDISATTYSSESFYFPNGGWVSYRSSLGANVLLSCYDQEDTKNHIYNSYGSMGDILIGVLGVIPVTGLWFGSISLGRAVANALAKRDIDSANGYSTVMYVESDDGEIGTVISGWYDYPTLFVHNFETVAGSGWF